MLLGDHTVEPLRGRLSPAKDDKQENLTYKTNPFGGETQLEPEIGDPSSIFERKKASTSKTKPLVGPSKREKHKVAKKILRGGPPFARKPNVGRGQVAGHRKCHYFTI